MSKFRLIAIGVLLSLLAVDSVSAGIFGFGRRRWERRKAELRSELVYDLSNKLDQDLAREVEAVTAELTAVAETQVKMESEKLEQQVQQALVRLREHASQLVAAEAQKLTKNVSQQVAQLKQESKKLVGAETSKIKQQTDKEIARLNAQFAEQTKAMRGTVTQELARIPALVAQQVKKSMPKIEGKPAGDETSDTAPKPIEGSNASTAQPAAALTKEVQLTGTDGDTDAS